MEVVLEGPIAATAAATVAKGTRANTGTAILAGSRGFTGDLVYPSKTVLPKVGSGYGLDFAGDFYYRVWVIPLYLVALNPRVGTPIPFKLWNAYPWPNVLTQVVGVDAQGLDLSIAANTPFETLEIKEPTITITSSAPPEVKANFRFTFREGSGVLFFEASTSNLFVGIPEYPIEEQWEWKTDIIQSFRAVEQRISLRQSPRLRMKLTYPLQTVADWRREYLQLFTKLSSRVTVPLFQSQTHVEQEAAIGDTDLFFDTQRCDVRAGEFLLVVDPRTEEGTLLKVQELLPGGVRLEQVLTSPITKRDILAPGVTVRVAEGAAFQMGSRIGVSEIPVESVDIRPPLRRPGSVTPLQYLQDYPILAVRPMVPKDLVETSFFSGYEVLDAETGVQEFRTRWPHSYPEGSRSFFVQRQFEPAIMDFWKEFFHVIQGRQKSFLASTWRSDFTLTEDVTDGAGLIQILDKNYSLSYFPNKCCQYLQFETESGELYFKRVVSAKDDPDTGIATLDLEGVLPALSKETRVSFLHMCRLKTDEITFQHFQTYSILTMGIRVVDQ